MSEPLVFGTTTFEWEVAPLDDGMVMVKHPDDDIEVCHDMEDALERVRWAMESVSHDLRDDGEPGLAASVHDAIADVDV